MYIRLCSALSEFVKSARSSGLRSDQYRCRIPKGVNSDHDYDGISGGKSRGQETLEWMAS